MLETIQALETEIRRSLRNDFGRPHVEVILSRDFASDHPEHRKALRARLVEVYTKLEAHKVDSATLTRLTDLAKPPIAKGWAISISHCPLIGGLVAGPSDHHLGFDFELTSRVRPEIAKRVAVTDVEKALLESNTPDISPITKPALFWSAKEASIKLIGNQVLEQDRHARTPVFNVIEISSLAYRPSPEPLSNTRCYFFEGRYEEILIHGTSFQVGDLTVSLAARSLV
ncbi:MAG: 4'-phosphopantetheinyl transferase superfamily protein [Bdellovibrionales bacterium]|jgi:hypothetical protein|nr:4'-phosphopantetheinyl transferase superfamily protein [Bdellovibrionales bacterium]